MTDPFRRVKLGLGLFALVLVGGSLGYLALGFGALDAVYQTVTTVTTVGFREVHPLTEVGKVFTMVLILGGVGTALYTFGVLVEALVEGHFSRLLGRRRMDHDIRRLQDHIVICGWGHVGRAIRAVRHQFWPTASSLWTATSSGSAARSICMSTVTPPTTR